MTVDISPVQQIADSLRLFVKPGQVGEVRFIADGISSGVFFRHAEIDDTAQHIDDINGRYDAVYVPLNVIKTDYPKRFNQHVKKELTTDAAIESRQFILIDCDPRSPERGAKDSATDAEKEFAKQVRDTVAATLKSEGWPTPIVADSGNGYHLLYRCHLPAITPLVRDFLHELDRRYSTAECGIDKSVSNAGRITKLYGTLARKGRPTEERPHRRSQIIFASDDEAIVTERMLLQFIRGKQQTLDEIDYTQPEGGGNLVKVELSGVMPTKPRLLLPEKIEAGGRHEGLVAIAANARSIGSTREEIVGVLQIYNKLRCNGEKPIEELVSIAGYMAAKNANESMQSYVDDYFRDTIRVGDTEDDGLLLPAPVDPGAFKIDIANAPGVLGAMVRYNLDYAPRPQGELAFFSSLTTVAAACGQLIRTKSDLRPNLNVLVMSEAGNGKDFPRAIAEQALRESGNEARIGPEKLRSDKAFVRFLHECGSLLVQTDEIMSYFEAVQQKGAAMHVKNIVEIIKEAATSSSKSHWNPMATGDSANDKVIPFPHLNLFCTGTKDSWGALGGALLHGGFIPRWVVYETLGRSARLRINIEPAQLPETILGPLRDWSAMRLSGGNLVGAIPSAVRPAVIVPVDDDAALRFAEHNEGIEDRTESDTLDANVVWRRASALAQKLALIFAASRGPFACRVTLRDAHDAIYVANYSARLLIDRMFKHVGHDEYDTEFKRAMHIVRQSGKITGRDFNRRLRCNVMKRDLLLKDMWGRRFIDIDGDMKGGRFEISYVTG